MYGLTGFGRPACSACRAHIVLARSRSKASSTTSFSTFAPTACPSSKLADKPAVNPHSRAQRMRLPDTPARTRFAPSPTGYLHLGSLRTALYNYLLARATKGQFLLRLEDTDQTRLVPDAEKRLYEDLAWAGLTWDEGPDRGGPYGPYRQSERLAIYHDYAEQLLRSGKAFRCFCSPDDLAAHQNRALHISGAGAELGAYPGRCLILPPGEAAARAAAGERHTVRFRGGGREPMMVDVVYGVTSGRLRGPADHFVLIKGDGFPTYHFANVVDDHWMGITHVVRGAEWLVSTPRHLRLYAAFGWTPPTFAHVGLLVDAARQKLSKRDGHISIDAYARSGIPPSVLLNFAALLGWRGGADHTHKNGRNNAQSNTGVMTLDDMVSQFNLQFTKGDIVVNPDKLAFLHRRHVRRVLDGPPAAGDLVDAFLLTPMLENIRATDAARQIPGSQEATMLGPPVIPVDAITRSRLRDLLAISRSDAVTATPIIAANRFLLWRPSAAHIRSTHSELLSILDGRVDLGLDAVDGEEAPCHGATHSHVISSFAAQLGAVDTAHWTAEHLVPIVQAAAKHVVCHKDDGSIVTVGYNFLRWALLGLADGPQMVPLLVFLGRSEALERLRQAHYVAESAITDAEAKVEGGPQ